MFSYQKNRLWDTCARESGRVQRVWFCSDDCPVAIVRAMWKDLLALLCTSVQSIIHPLQYGIVPGSKQSWLLMCLLYPRPRPTYLMYTGLTINQRIKNIKCFSPLSVHARAPAQSSLRDILAPALRCESCVIKRHNYESLFLKNSALVQVWEMQTSHHSHASDNVWHSQKIRSSFMNSRSESNTILRNITTSRDLTLGHAKYMLTCSFLDDST